MAQPLLLPTPYTPPPAPQNGESHLFVPEEHPQYGFALKDVRK
jgi:hypothetical protein